MHLFHKWQIVGARQGTVSYAWQSVGNPITFILKKCSVCGAPGTSEIAGWWTLEQLLAGEDRS